MNFREQESSIKLRGGYYTDPRLVRFMLRWAVTERTDSILEPSCGDGVFFRELSLLDHQIEYVLGFEIEPTEAEKAGKELSLIEDVKGQVLNRDFLSWSLRHLIAGNRFDAVVGNPPFIRYQYWDSDFQDTAKELFNFFKLPFTKHTNAWVPFVIASIALLKPGGRLAMIIPSEIMHVIHAQSLRTFLAKECSRIMIVDPEEIWFHETLQGAVIILAQKKQHKSDVAEGLSIVSIKNREFVYDNPNNLFNSAIYENGEVITGKWTWALLSNEERTLLNRLKRSPNVKSFQDIAQVAVGIVTGANKYFLVDDATVDKYDLQDWAYPMFGRSEHAPGVIYDDLAHDNNRKKGLPTNFLWLEANGKGLSDGALKYIELGEDKGFHTRYKCRIRKPWYVVPSVYATSVGMLKRCHNFPKLIHNQKEAFTTDTAYRVKSLSLPPSQLVYLFLNSLTALSAELEGRSYGGGVLELVPSEIRKLLIPVSEVETSNLTQLHKKILDGMQPQEILRSQDNCIFPNIGLSKLEIEVIHEAWDRLRKRRQRWSSD